MCHDGVFDGDMMTGVDAQYAAAQDSELRALVVIHDVMDIDEVDMDSGD